MLAKLLVLAEFKTFQENPTVNGTFSKKISVEKLQSVEPLVFPLLLGSGSVRHSNPVTQAEIGEQNPVLKLKIFCLRIWKIKSPTIVSSSCFRYYRT